MKKFFLLLLLSFLPMVVNAQVTWEPYFANDTDSLYVYFDASQGSKGLLNYAGDVYAHTGVLTNLSVGTSGWRYVKTNWGVNTPETKLERISTNLYRFAIKPGIRAFYNVPAAEQINAICFVFRSGVQVNGAYLEGKTSSGGDIFVPLFGAGLNVAFKKPNVFPYFAANGETISIQAVGSHSKNIKLYVDNSLVSQTTDSVLNFDYVVNSTGKKWVRAVASNDTGAKADSFYFVVNAPVNTAELPAGIEDGINYISNSSVVLSLYAPNKNYVYAMGSFSNWEIDPKYMMNRTSDGKRYWVQIDNLVPQQEYTFQYLVDGTIKIADPYAEKVLDPWNDGYITNTLYPNLIAYPAGKTTEIVSVFQTAQTPYNWTVTNFQKPKKTDLVIYELLIRDFVTTHSYKTIGDTLEYFKNLGVTAIELMPVMEFEGNESWGYNPSFHSAPDKYYGPKDQLKRFIDLAHQKGIAVILDIVLNHTMGSSPLARLYWDAANNRPAVENPWLNPVAKHPYNVGNDFNHESDATKYYVDKVTKFWLTNYKVDGFRFDLSKGFTQVNSGSNVSSWGQYDQSRINILKRMADQIWAVSSDAIIILEHFADNTEEKVLSDYGMMLWGNMNNSYLEASMGYASDFSWGYYGSRGWSSPNLVSYMESHDEERMMVKNIAYGNSSGTYNVKDPATALNRVKLAEAFFYTIPGAKMLWQFGELGYDVSIDYNGRVGNKPIKWNYYSEAARKSLYDVTAAIIKLKQYDAFETSNVTLNTSGYFKRIKLVAPSMDVLVLGNFNVINESYSPGFTKTGYWYDYLSGDSLNVSDPNASVTYIPGEYHIYTSVKLPKPVVTAVKDDEVLADVKDYRLFNNYPNPFNPSTVISYSLPEASNVKVEVFDALGKRIAVLVNEYQTSGYYKVNFSSSEYNLASGIYFTRLTSGNKVYQNKMLLLK